ncbi:MAG: fibrobacter succinogenes major paralogous domain-containing protein, partial [Bacteroidales bacterium]|nr:fibrobacter succinogenes major paralogous domain-containing protein [Bacteroidales bacterium]
SGTNAGTYPMSLNSTDFENTNDNFATVTFNIVNGQLVINKIDATVTITEHSDTVDYNGQPHTVSGYDVEISTPLYTTNDFTFSGDSTVSGTNVGTYPMSLVPGNFANMNSNFDQVTFNVTDGQLVINKINVTVTITGHHSASVYDATEHSVSGYDVEIVNPLYTASDFTFTPADTAVLINGVISAKRTDVGTSYMGLAANQFANINTNFDTVTFNVTDGYHHVTSVDGVVVTITGHKDTTVYDGTEHSISGYEVQISNSLYTTANFTFNGTQEAARTNVGTTYMGLAANQFTNNSVNFTNVVFEVTDGYQMITPATLTIAVTGHTDTLVFNGAAQSVTGYDLACDSSLYDASKVVLNGTAMASGTYVGTYPMNLTNSQFSYNDANFANVTFNVTDGHLTIKPATLTIAVTGHIDTLVFNGTEQNVTGYDLACSSSLYNASKVAFNGTDEASGTNVGTYPMNLMNSQFSYVDTNFTNVTFNVTDGHLTIKPATLTIAVTGHVDTLVFNGTEQNVNGYDLACVDALYDASKVVHNGTAVASGTNVGTYPMNLTNSQFSYDDTNFAGVTFNVTDGHLTIKPFNNVLVTITEHTDTVMYDGQSHTVTGYDVTTSNALYTAADFTTSYTTADTTMTGVAAGTYHSSMETTMFQNANTNFTGVSFEIVRKGLVINKNNQAIVITSGSRDFNYDGNAHSYPSYTVTYNGTSVPRVSTDSTKFTLPTGDILSVNNPASITYYSENAPNNNTFTYTLENADSYDAAAVTSNYGTIGISAMSQEIRIASLGTSWNYDGEAYSYKHYTVKFGDDMVTTVENDTIFTLPTGDRLTITDAPSIRYVGKIANSFTYTLENEILYVGDRIIVFDTLRVNPKPDVITITANSAEKAYDGTPLTNNGYTYVPANVLVPGDTLVVEVVGTITEAGDSLNRIVNYKVYRNEGVNAAPRMRGLMMMSAPSGYNRDVTDCYTFATAPVDGTLRVTKNGNVTVTITGHTGEFGFDETVHHVHGYDVTISDTLGIYSVADFSFSGDSTLDESAVGTYNMNLAINQFTNNNNNYEPVNFVVNDGWMKIYERLTVDVNSTTDETCAGEANGSVAMLVTGGQPGNPRYSYTVIGSVTHDSYTGGTNGNINLNMLRPDSYAVTVSDGLGTTATATFTIATEPAINASNSTFTCPANIDTVIRHGGCNLKLALGEPVFTTTSGVDLADIVISNNAPADSIFQAEELTVTWTATDHCGNTLTCDQTVKVSFQTCPDAVDFEGTHYPSVRLGSGCKCWTTENLKSTQYSDGRPIDNVMVYVSSSYPNEAQNLNIFGRLYDWYAAADTATHSVAEIESMYALGQRVQGVCPAGWYLPSEEDFDELNVYPTTELRSNEYWIDGASNTNATGFNSVPSGRYNCATSRFEELMGNAYYWTCHPVYDTSTGAMIDFICEKVVITPPMTRCNGFSIRCVLVEQ